MEAEPQAASPKASAMNRMTAPASKKTGQRSRQLSKLNENTSAFFSLQHIHSNNCHHWGSVTLRNRVSALHVS